MLRKIAKATAIFTLTTSALFASQAYNEVAENDRKALVDYFEAKFEEPFKNKNTFFPYSTDEELRDGYAKGLKFEDFSIGSYSYALDARGQYEAINEMPPYEDGIDAGAELYEKEFANGNSFASCFPEPAEVSKYPYFDESRQEVLTLTQMVNECLTTNGEKPWNTKKGDMANLQAYLVSEARDAEKKIDIHMDSQAAADAYQRGKEYYYTQRGYLKMSCATCHVQGAGQRVRNEKLSPLLGQITHFPVYRLKWGGLGTLERRMSGCIKDEGQVPPGDVSQEMKELLYFMSYMSNGMKIDGPDIRK